ncbi:unnamed protein product [Soboliphyme baturini]|uniref:MBF1 domain-containing protein n=1 Tax=Soboliphyme baturini TaxID=241478 RepID=A0A183IFL5_9BILA|nr:unnamed protein product [Soboliphyme baturini]
MSQTSPTKEFGVSDARSLGKDNVISSNAQKQGKTFALHAIQSRYHRVAADVETVQKAKIQYDTGEANFAELVNEFGPI